MTSVMKSGGALTVSRRVLIVRPSMRFTGAIIMSSSLSHAIGSCRRVRSDSPRRMKIASMPAAMARSKRATSAMSRYISSSTYTRCGVATGLPWVSRTPGYFIFMVRFGQFPENGQRQMAYIIYLIKVRGNAYKKVHVF